MSVVNTYTNETKKKQKVYVDGVTGPFKILAPGASCRVRLDADQEVRAVDYVEPKKKAAEKE